MATISATVTHVSNVRGEETVKTAVWAGATDADTLTPLALGPVDGAVHFSAEGAWGSPGATASIAGSPLAATLFKNLADDVDAAIALTADGWAEVKLRPLYFQPVVTGGTGESLNLSLTWKTGR